MHPRSYVHSRKIFGVIITMILLHAPLLVSGQNNALWVWNTRQIIDRQELKDSLLAATEQLKINTLFLYFPHDISADGDSLSFYQRDSLIALLVWAKEHSLKVHAMAGEPEWALKWNHNRPLAFAREVVKLLRETGMPDGIQFDIEPYLLLPFSLPQTKEPLIRDWIYIVWKIGKLIREENGLVYGIAVPFWLEDSIAVEDNTLPIGHHLTYLADYLAVMAYRDKAEGEVSVISFSEKERQWAEQSRRKIYIGIETKQLLGSTSHYFCEVQPDTFSQRIDDQFDGYSNFHYRNRKITVIVVDGKVLLGVEGSDIPQEEMTELRSGVIEIFDGKEMTVPLQQLKNHIRKSESIESLTEITLNDGSTAIQLITAELLHSTMLHLTREDFDREYSVLRKHADQYSEIEGIAVHHFMSVRKFLK